MSYYAYVIFSPSHNRYYKGHCQNIDARLKEHNSGKTRSIKSYIPFELIYYEKFETREEAISREKYFKTAAGRIYLKSKMNK
jgi:putative endonuclease